MINNNIVGLVKEQTIYNNIPPFHPSEKYPEFPSYPVSETDNPAFRGVRKLFYLLNLDLKNYDNENWSPLSEIVKQGDRVIIKPNLVHHLNMNKNLKDEPLDCLLTHGSIVRVAIDYVAKALNYQGIIIIGDAPIQGADFEKIIEITGFNKIKEFFEKNYGNIKIEIEDFRLAKAISKSGRQIERIETANSIGDYIEVDIKESSLLIPIMKNKYKFGVAQYSYKKMISAHNLTSNKYLFPKKILNADVIINIPKLKFHKRAGITCSLKNLVGIIGHKDYLPHFRYGSPKNNGDEYPDGGLLWDLRWFFEHREWEKNKGAMKKFYFKCIYIMRGIMRKGLGYPDNFDNEGSGGWYGNDTLWRTVLDINRAFFYYNKITCKIEDTIDNTRKYFTIVDGIVGGDKNSPLAPSPVKSGLLLAGYNPVAVDTTATSLMGFDTKKIKQISEAYKIDKLKLCDFNEEDIYIANELGVKSISDIYKCRQFQKYVAAKGYNGHIEFKDDRI